MELQNLRRNKQTYKGRKEVGEENAKDKIKNRNKRKKRKKDRE
jgi:hypothetical protein